jgi:hypothetical protein
MKAAKHPQLITGRMVPAPDPHDKPFLSPVGGKNCFFYQVSVKEYFKHNTSKLDTYEWVKRKGEHKAVNFYLADPSKTERTVFIKATVLPIRKISDDASRSETTLSSYDFGRGGDALREFIHRHHLDSISNSVMLKESALVIGDQVAILGVVSCRQENQHVHYYLDPVLHNPLIITFNLLLIVISM